MELNYGIVYAILYLQNVQSALTNKNWKLLFWHDIYRCCLMLLLLSHYYFYYYSLLFIIIFVTIIFIIIIIIIIILLLLLLSLLLFLLPSSLSLLFFELLSTLHFALCSCSPDIIYTCRLHELGAHKSLLLSKLDFIVLLDNCCPLSWIAYLYDCLIFFVQLWQ